MDFWNRIGDAVIAVSDAVCGYPFFTLLVGGGLFFLCYSGFAPIRHYGKAIQALRVKDASSAGQISSFEALSTAIAATVGMGNVGQRVAGYGHQVFRRDAGGYVQRP